MSLIDLHSRVKLPKQDEIAGLVVDMLDRGIAEREHVPALCIWRCSGLGRCPRCLCLEAKGETPRVSAKENVERLKRFHAGTAMHDRIQTSLRDWCVRELLIGARPVGFEVPLWDLDLRIGGHVDSVIKIPCARIVSKATNGQEDVSSQPSPENALNRSMAQNTGFQTIILEIKSANSWALSQLRQKGAASSYWLPQIAAYTWLGAKRWPDFAGTVIYVESKDDPNERWSMRLTTESPEFVVAWNQVREDLNAMNRWVAWWPEDRPDALPDCRFPKKCPHKR